MNCSTWSPDTMIPNCVFGTCNPNNNTCVCDPGFQHDKVMGHFENCGLPNWAPWVFFSITLSLLLFSCGYSFWVFVKHAQYGSPLWRACGASSLSSLFFMLSLFSLMSQDFSMPWFGALFTSLGSVASAHVAGQILVSVLSPVAADFSNQIRSMHKIECFFLYVLPLFMLGLLILCTAFGFGFKKIALGMGFVYCTVGVCALLALPALMWFPTLLIRALQTSLENEYDRSNKLKRILHKVRVFRLSSSLCAVGTCVICFLASSLQFVYETLPMSWVLYFGFVCGLSLFHVQVAQFGKPSTSTSREAEEESSSSRQQQKNKVETTIPNPAQAIVASSSSANVSSEPAVPQPEYL